MKSVPGGFPMQRVMITDFRTLAPSDLLSRAVEYVLADFSRISQSWRRMADSVLARLQESNCLSMNRASRDGGVGVHRGADARAVQRDAKFGDVGSGERLTNLNTVASDTRTI